MAGMAKDRDYNVLFLCTHNSARSVIAEAILNRLGKGTFHAFSAGSQPRGEVNPFAIALLEKLDYDTTSIRSKSWDEFAAAGAPEMDFVFTVCDNAANEVCPVARKSARTAATSSTTSTSWSTRKRARQSHTPTVCASITSSAAA